MLGASEVVFGEASASLASPVPSHVAGEKLAFSHPTLPVGAHQVISHSPFPRTDYRFKHLMPTPSKSEPASEHFLQLPEDPSVTAPPLGGSPPLVNTG